MHSSLTNSKKKQYYFEDIINACISCHPRTLLCCKAQENREISKASTNVFSLLLLTEILEAYKELKDTASEDSLKKFLSAFKDNATKVK